MQCPFPQCSGALSFAWLQNSYMGTDDDLGGDEGMRMMGTCYFFVCSRVRTVLWPALQSAALYPVETAGRV